MDKKLDTTGLFELMLIHGEYEPNYETINSLSGLDKHILKKWLIKSCLRASDNIVRVPSKPIGILEKFKKVPSIEPKE